MTRWLVTGGAGYIGAHVAQALIDSGREVTVIDSLSSGRREFVPEAARFVEGSLLDRDAVTRALEGATGVIHLAGYKYAGESVRHPLHTYTQKVTGTVELLEAMREAEVTEATATTPESPYGESKLIGEWMLWNERRRAELEGGSFSPVSLRYFNVIGSATGRIRDTSPHNVVPKVLAGLAAGRTPTIFGDDYATPDGTNVRDYVHVQDVALAHVAAAERLESGQPIESVYNLGSGAGSSTRQIIEAILKATGSDEAPEVGPRRPGDPASIVADGTLAARDLDWQMRYSIDEMIASAVSAADARD